MNVDTYISIFREALTALVAVLEKSGIDLKNDDVLENYELAFESLFQCIVNDEIEARLAAGNISAMPLPKYGFYYKDYSKISFISVKTGDDNAKLVLVFLKTKSKPFDTVYCNSIDDDGKVVAEGIEIPYTGCKFLLEQFN